MQFFVAVKRLLDMANAEQLAMFTLSLAIMMLSVMNS